MRNIVSVMLVAIGLAWTQYAAAYPTLGGPTGNAALPTAETAGPGVFQVAADYVAGENGTVPLRLVVGLGCPFELGITYTPGEQLLDDATVIFADPLVVDAVRQQDLLGAHAKAILPFHPGNALVALGAQYYTGDLQIDFLDLDSQRYQAQAGTLTATQVYLVATKAFTPCDGIPVVRGTLGVNWTQVERDIDDAWVDPFAVYAEDHSAVRIFAAADATFFDLFTLAAEYQTKNGGIETDPLYSVVGRFTISPRLQGQVGFTNAAGVVGTDDTRLFFGINYLLGPNR